MVIANSDSTGTLESLGHGRKHQEPLLVIGSTFDVPSAPQTPEHDPVQWEETCLYLPAAELSMDYDSDEEDMFHSYDDDDEDDDAFVVGRPLYLPQQQPSDCTTPATTPSVDECLQWNSTIRERAQDLLDQHPVHYTRQTQDQRLVYVGQGEVAHATAQQCDVLVSDRATTCHIVVLHSTSGSNKPLASCTHLDSPKYNDCLRAMVLEHVHHHGTKKRITMRVHVVGGFDDESSRKLSNWLIYSLSALAQEFREELTMVLQTCAISSLNSIVDPHCGLASPIGRGLAVDVSTGQVWLASVDGRAMGPDPALRSARLWSPDPNAPAHLHNLFAADDKDVVEIAPFHFQAFPGLAQLLRLPDAVLLEYCSTSPHCEEADFCESVRRTLSFLQQERVEDVFLATQSLSSRGLQARRYQRIGSSNRWALM